MQIPASVHDEILQLLLETDPDTTEQILKRLSNEPWWVGEKFIEGKQPFFALQSADIMLDFFNGYHSLS